MSKEKTKVVFRVWPDGGVIALFPQISADQFGYYCQMYEHVGQHGGGSVFAVVNRTRLAKPKEYRDLLKELQRIGYKGLVVGKRCTTKDRTIRRMEAQGTLLLLKP